MDNPFKLPNDLGSLSFKEPKIKKTRQPKPLKGPALKTQGSNLEKFLDVLNKPGAIERQTLINAIQGDDLTKGLGDIAGVSSDKSLLQNLNGVFSSNEATKPTGGDVIQAIRGQGAPTTTLGKIAQGTAGFAADVFNPLDPLNWIGVGELSKTGQALEKAGKLSGFVKGLQTGERSILSARLPFTGAIAHAPGAASRLAGGGLEALGREIKAVPGVEKITNLFKPTFNVLKDSSTKIGATAKRLVSNWGGKGLEDQLAGLKNVATKKVTSDLASINPRIFEHYKTLGLNPEQMVNHEIFRGWDQGIANTRREIKNPVLAKIANSIPKEGPTIPEIQKIVDTTKPLYKDMIKKQRASGKYASSLEKYGPRFVDEAGHRQMENLGIPLEAGKRITKEFTMEEANAISKDPAGRAAMYSKVIGTAPLEKKPQLFDSFRKTDPAGADFYNFDALQGFGKKLAQSSKAVGTANALTDIVANPSLARKSKEAWIGSGMEGQIAKVEVPKEFQKIAGSELFVPQDTAHEFRNFMDIFTDTDKANKAVGAFDASWRTLTGLYKKLTLLTPLGGLHTALRDHMGNHFQSYMAGAWSPTGNAIAAKLESALLKAGNDPAKLAQIADTLGTHAGLDLGKEVKLMEESGLLNEGFSKALFGDEHFNKAEKALLMPQIAKGREISENFSRIQHYITRRLQGWSPEGALKDTRKIMYDYVAGLSPYEKKLQNIFPWYTWSRFNIPMMVMQGLRHPGKSAEFYRAKTNIESGQPKTDERALDEYIKGDPHIRLFQDPNTGNFTYLRIKGFLPVGDLEDITSMEKFGNFMVSSLTPYIKAPAENAFNASTFFKTAGGAPAQIEKYPGETGKFLGMDISRKNINLLKNIRPLNEINRLAGMFGGEAVSGKPASLTPAGYGLNTLGVSLVPVDKENAIKHARLAYMKQLSDLKMAKKYKQSKGENTSQVDQLMQQLSNESFNPGK